MKRFGFVRSSVLQYIGLCDGKVHIITKVVFATKYTRSFLFFHFTEPLLQIDFSELGQKCSSATTWRMIASMSEVESNVFCKRPITFCHSQPQKFSHIQSQSVTFFISFLQTADTTSHNGFTLIDVCGLLQGKLGDYGPRKRIRSKAQTENWRSGQSGRGGVRDSHESWRRFHRRQKSGNVSTCTRLWSNEVLVKRSWLLESPFLSFSTMCFMQTKIPHAFVNAELRRKSNRNIIPTSDIRRGSWNWRGEKLCVVQVDSGRSNFQIPRKSQKMHESRLMSVRWVQTWKPSDEHPQGRRGEGRRCRAGTWTSRGCWSEGAKFDVVEAWKKWSSINGLRSIMLSWSVRMPSLPSRRAMERRCRKSHMFFARALHEVAGAKNIPVGSAVQLSKAVYGLGNAPRSWCDGVHLFAIAAACLDAASVAWDCHSSCSCNTHEPVCALPLQILYDCLAQDQVRALSRRLKANCLYHIVRVDSVCLVTKEEIS